MEFSKKLERFGSSDLHSAPHFRFPYQVCLRSSRPPPSLSAWKLYSATSGSFSILYCYLSHWCDNPGRGSKGTFFPCEEQKSSFCCSWRGTKTCSLKTGSWTSDDGLFGCSVSFLFCPSYLLILFTACNKWACCQGPFPATHPSRSVALQCHFIKNMHS